MPTDGSTLTVEGFVTDLAFMDQSQSINGVLVNESQKVAGLTPRVLSYFSTPSSFKDPRLSSTRDVNWVTETNPEILFDETVFESFVDIVNTLGNNVSVGFFKIVDKLLFKYTTPVNKAAIEAFLLEDEDIAAIYTPDSFNISATVVSDIVHLANNTTTQAVTVPSFVTFEVALPTGGTTTSFSIKLYASVDSFLVGYNFSTIVRIVPPLPYDKLFNASLVTTTDNIFTTASTTASLSYSNTQALLGTVSVSGIVEYSVAITDGVRGVSVPFNLIYKGRAPTTFEIRNAIREAILTSGFGTELGWKDRIPGVFVSGRFYIVPIWDATFTKPDQVIYPNITSYSNYATVTNKILESLGYGDVTNVMELLAIYYNQITATVVPDLSGIVGDIDAGTLTSIIPDYQNFSSTDEQFAYMSPLTQQFSRDINAVLAIDSGAQSSIVYTTQTEGLLTFYAFTVGNYEICVITKQGYEIIMESTQ